MSDLKREDIFSCITCKGLVEKVNADGHEKHHEAERALEGAVRELANASAIMGAMWQGLLGD